ncbi:cation:proton antiporter [Cyanobium sp. BA5m-21]|uniref:cation:proton antiporter domain-containing protein n=1 Tax=unclassified Cyanobium TaxID=2627006 RepID=UPI0020CE7356|nr:MULTISPECIES: cation:proton antiporter [unclassified Cyanobium]MCP9902667.1 cation:proton antiporter [Cyanobium sp. BA5m-10]MCP9906374.1 cation:proton antiporter [Cyanobium sp. BA5m-21]
MTPERLGLLWGVTVFAGATAQALAWLTGLPGVVLLLSAGLVIGRSGFGLVEPLDLGAGLGTVVGLLVSLVLFDGGINLRLPGDATKQAVLRIVLATGPTVVTPLVRQIRLAPPLGEVLEGEGLILEPIGAVLALLLLELALGDLHGWRELALGLLQRLGGGVVIGALCGWLLAEALRRIPAQPAGALRLQLTLGTLFLMFSGCELLLPESGLPTAVAAGVVVGRRPDIDAAELDELIRQLAQLAITMLFPLLAADVSWAELSPLGWGGVACVLSLMLLVRPVAIGLATWGLDFSLPQRALMSWLAPRGIVTAAVAGRLQGLVFLTILLTVGLQGLSAGPLARWLGLSEAAGDAGAVVAASVQQQPGGK